MFQLLTLLVSALFNELQPLSVQRSAWTTVAPVLDIRLMWNINTRSKQSFYHQIVYIYQSSLLLIIVVKTCRRADALRAIFICCANFLSVYTHLLFFFAFCCTNWHIWWMNRHPLSLKGGATCFLMVHHNILSLILKYHFCASSSRELSVCAIFLRVLQLCFRYCLTVMTRLLQL